MMAGMSNASLKDQVITVLRTGNWPLAKSLCVRLCAEAKDDPESWMLAAFIDLQLSAPAQALPSAERALALNTDNPEIHTLKGYCLHQLGRYDEAIACYDHALTLRPNDAKTCNHLGNSYGVKKNLEAALDCYRRAIVADPNFADAHTNLGSILQAQGQTADAIACHRHALSLQPRHTQAHCNLGKLLAAEGELEQAEICYRDLLRVQANHVEGRYGLATVLKAQSKLEEALAVYRELVQQQPKHAEAWFAMGIINGRLGRFERSEACYKQAIAHQADYSEAYNNLGALMNTAKNYTLALDYFQQALNHNPDYAQPYYNMGIAYWAVGKVEDARACMHKALKLKPDFGQASYQLVLMDGGTHTPDKAPPDYVAGLFDQYAWNFDKHLVEGLNYRTPELLHNALREFVQAVQPRSLEVLDIGCGTGLCGPLLRDLARRLIGVDLSSGMLAKARERQVYDELIVGDIIDYMRERPQSFDLIIAADVFPYLGALEAVFAAAHSALRPTGLFVYSTEAGSVDVPYALGEGGRYAHGADYLQNLHTTANLHVLRAEEAVLRMENAKPVNGHLRIAGKADAPTGLCS